MAWSQSIFLQALGWATLNSFWQLGLLWCVVQLAGCLLRPSSNQRYLLGVYGLFAGAAWFIWTFLSYYVNGQAGETAFTGSFTERRDLLPAVLSAASVAYLLLLAFPALKLYRNWRYLKEIRNEGLTKAPAKYRVFVEKISAHIGIRKQVQVFLSGFVTSPVTIGYLKPVVLLPLAAINNLTPAQLEAVLLHELSHIRRYDYLVNLFLSAVKVVLYFNPFVRLFIRAIETERENCCDELVLQFEYDKVAYASALMELEKANHQTPVLAMGAANSSNLLARIERIIGIRHKPRMNAQHLLGAGAALLLLFILNAITINGSKPLITQEPAFAAAALPFGQFSSDRAAIALEEPKTTTAKPGTLPQPPVPEDPAPVLNELAYDDQPENEDREDNNDFQTVGYSESEARLSAAEKQEVRATVNNARKLLESQWQDVARNIPDGLPEAEREAVRRQYLSEVERINWQRFEQNLRAGYGKVNLTQMNDQLSQQIALAKIDSVRAAYEATLAEMQKLTAEKARVRATPIPDVSVTELRKAQRELERSIEELNELQGRKKKGVTKL